METAHNQISANDVYAARVRGEQIAIADVRSPSEFAAVHAIGARNYPLDELDTHGMVADFNIEGLGREVPLYITCYSGLRAEDAAARLVQDGYPNVALIEGGMQSWEASKLPVNRAARAWSLSVPQQVQVTVGSMLLIKTLLGVAVHPVFFVLTAALGAGLVYAGLTKQCMLERLLNRMPWNQLPLMGSR